MRRRKVRHFQRPDGQQYVVVLEPRPEGLVYVRYAKESHKCYQPVGWAFDRAGFEWAMALGITAIEVRTEEATYCCLAEVARKSGVLVDFGTGPQVLIPLPCWEVKEKNHPRCGQLTLFAEVTF